VETDGTKLLRDGLDDPTPVAVLSIDYVIEKLTG
jgi:hypothetical protein